MNSPSIPGPEALQRLPESLQRFCRLVAYCYTDEEIARLTTMRISHVHEASRRLRQLIGVRSRDLIIRWYWTHNIDALIASAAKPAEPPPRATFQELVRLRRKDKNHDDH